MFSDAWFLLKKSLVQGNENVFKIDEGLFG